MRSLPRLALCATLLTPSIAAADTVGPEQAQQLQQQLKDWLTGLVGPSVKLPDLPLEVTGEQDHYKLAWHVPGFESPEGDVAATVLLRPMDGGLWSIDSWKVPNSGSFSMTLPKTDDPALAGPMKLSFTLGKQDSHGVIDPALAAASTFHAEFSGLDMKSENPKQQGEQHIDHYVADASLKPAADGRLDLTSDGTMEGWKSATEINGQTPVAFGAKTVHAVGHVNGIDRAHVADLLTATRALIGAMPDKGAKTDMSAAAKAQVRLMLAAVQNILTSVSMEETLDDVQVEVAGVGGGTIKHVKLGFGGEAPAGMLHAWLDFGLEGLDSPTIPPKVAAYLPRHFEIKPSFSGVQTADLQKLARDATEDDKGKSSYGPDLAAIFSHGGANVNLETLSFDLGPAKIEGTGRFTALSPDKWHGQAHLTAAGFDELTTQAHDNPDLQQALPVLIMLRGLAKPDGDHLVWDIVSDGPKLTVNGMDMSALTGGGKPEKEHGAKPGHPAKP